MKQNREPTKIQRKKLCQSIGICWKKKLCMCILVSIFYESYDIEKLNAWSTKVEKGKKFINELVEKYKKMDKDFEQNYCSRTTKGIYRVEVEYIRLMKWMASYDKYYENISFLIYWQKINLVRIKRPQWYILNSSEW